MPPPAPQPSDDQALIASATLYDAGLVGIADRLVEGQILKIDIATDALGSPPGIGLLAVRR